MKKIINSSLVVSTLLLSCAAKEEKQAAVTIAPVTTVVGIGKVLPLGGMVELSLQQSNKIVAINKQVGDTVRAGDVLFQLEVAKEDLQLAQTQTSYQAAAQQLQAAQYDIQLGKIKLSDLKTEWETSKKLLRNKAETPQKVLQDSIAYAQQLVSLQQQEQQIKAQTTALKEQQIAIETSQLAQQDQSFRAIQGGVLIRFDVTLGSILAANSTFGELAPLTSYVVEGEVDEYYANLIKNGQTVDIVLVGQTAVVAQGNITYVSAGLQNKSILYEAVGEGTDRRVRRFTVQITKGQEQLLLNQKVECKINL